MNQRCSLTYGAQSTVWERKNYNGVWEWKFYAKSFVSVEKGMILSGGHQKGLPRRWYFSWYPEGWVGFHQADRRGGKRIPSRGNSMCKSLLKHIRLFFLSSLERANVSCSNVELGFFSHDYIAIFKYRTWYFKVMTRKDLIDLKVLLIKLWCLCSILHIAGPQ